jgi:hypothetical protein
VLRRTSTEGSFQAAVFADPPWVPDQQDEVDDFDIINVTRAGLVGELVPLASILLCVPTRFTPAFGDVMIDLIAQLKEGASEAEAALSSSGICRSSMGPGSAG